MPLLTDIVTVLSGAIAILVFITGKTYLTEFRWVKALPAWGRGLIIIVFIIASVGMVFLLLNRKTAPVAAAPVPTLPVDTTAAYKQPVTGTDSIISTPPATTPPTSTQPVVPKEKLYEGTTVVVRINNMQNDELSAALADVYRKQVTNVRVGNYPGLPARTSVMGNVTAAAEETDTPATGSLFTTWNVRLDIKIYRGKSSTPTAERTYEKQLPLAPGDSKDKAIRQGFNDIIYQLRSANDLPYFP